MEGREKKMNAKKYDEVFAACQAGGMNNAESHECATDHATRGVGAPTNRGAIESALTLLEDGHKNGQVAYGAGLKKSARAELAALRADNARLREALGGIETLSRDLAGSTMTLREIFGTFHQTQQIEGRRALAALAEGGARE